MKINNKTRKASIIASLAFVACQLFSTTAHADYQGYWADAVNNNSNAQAVSMPANNYQGYAQDNAYPAQPNYVPNNAPNYAPANNGYNNGYNAPAPNMAPVAPQAMHGAASYYSEQYQGRPTASGETYDMYAMTAAHPSLPFGTPLRVTNVQTGQFVIVRVNDRGPFKPGRIVDVSLAAAQQLGLILNGSAEVAVEVVG